jgi:hypothetical protein
MAIIGVASERDAEAIRQEYYGQTIDSSVCNLIKMDTS